MQGLVDRAQRAQGSDWAPLSQGFKELKDLKVIDLSDIKISGDLAVLANCTNLEVLFLSKTPW